MFLLCGYWPRKAQFSHPGVIKTRTCRIQDNLAHWCLWLESQTPQEALEVFNCNHWKRDQQHMRLWGVKIYTTSVAHTWTKGMVPQPFTQVSILCLLVLTCTGAWGTGTDWYQQTDSIQGALAEGSVAQSHMHCSVRWVSLHTAGVFLGCMLFGCVSLWLSLFQIFCA